MQLIGRVIRGDAHVVLVAGLKNAGAELVEARIILRGFDLVDELAIGEGDHVGLAVGVFAGLEDVDVERNIAIGDVEHEVDQPRLVFAERESEPLEALEHGRVTIFVLRGSVRPLVVAAKDGLAQFEGLCGLPGAVGSGGNDAAVQLAGSGRCGRGLRNLVHGRRDLGKADRPEAAEKLTDTLARGSGPDGHVEIKVRSMKPLRLDLALSVVDRDAHGIIALDLCWVFHCHRDRIEVSRPPFSQLEGPRGVRPRLTGMDRPARPQGHSNDRCNDDEWNDRSKGNASDTRRQTHG